MRRSHQFAAAPRPQHPESSGFHHRRPLEWGSVWNMAYRYQLDPLRRGCTPSKYQNCRHDFSKRFFVLSARRCIMIRITLRGSTAQPCIHHPFQFPENVDRAKSATTSVSVRMVSNTHLLKLTIFCPKEVVTSHLGPYCGVFLVDVGPSGSLREGTTTPPVGD